MTLSTVLYSPSWLPLLSTFMSLCLVTHRRQIRQTPTLWHILTPSLLLRMRRVLALLPVRRVLRHGASLPVRCQSAVSPSPSLSPTVRWSALSKHQQSTLMFLGCSEEQWNSSLPPSLDLPHDRLTLQQQAAVQHGLGLTAAQWDAFVAEHRGLADGRASDSVSEAARTGTSSSAVAEASSYMRPSAPAVSLDARPTQAASALGAVARSAAGAAWSVAKVAIPLLRPVFSKSKHPLAPFALLAGTTFVGFKSQAPPCHATHNLYHTTAGELFLRSSVLVEATQAPVTVEVGSSLNSGR